MALITGGARGIGRAVALDLARLGWCVAICYRTSASDAEQVVEAAREAGSDAFAAQHDVSDPTAAKQFVDEVRERWGHVDALVNGAGPFHRVDILDETPEGWRDMFANNLDSVFYMSHAVATGMIERGSGRIISFSMANADQLVAQTGLTAHYIAKAGVLVLTRTLAKSLAPHGITVNAISPGFIDSGNMSDGELASVAKRIPAGYVGSVEDAVGVVRFLLSADARYVTGANIHLSGGWGI